MPYARIENSGVAVRGGRVQVRVCFYLDPADTGYDKCHIQMPDFSGAAYSGELDEFGSPVDEVAYAVWVASLPKVWQDNPFHNHFIYVDAATSEKEIRALMDAHLKEFYLIWSGGGEINTEYREKARFTEGSPEQANLAACADKVAILKSKEVKV
jgi:hypothetical protein